MNFKKFIEKWNTKELIEDKLLLLRNRIVHQYWNKPLIEFLEQLISVIPNKEQKIHVLEYAKKTLMQTPRKIENEYLRSVEDEFFDEIEEQKEYDPVKWIELELSFLAKQSPMDNTVENTNSVKLPKNLYENTDELLDMKEILSLLKISKSTLDRWRFDGLPIKKAGKKLFGQRKEIVNWLEKKDAHSF